ncbi:MAG: zinc-finger domain-containing protein [Rhodospirillales bacterium]|nr:zinc-finger domain-containing protein [Rhodospirillales bacterium]
MPVQTPEMIVVADDVSDVKCDGGGGALGHPVVWYTFDGKDVVECLYCDRAFVKKRAEKAFKAGKAA